MTHISILVIAKMDDQHVVIGRGKSKEEAVLDCLQNCRQYIFNGMELAQNVVLPLNIAAKVPTTLPDGHGLFILECCSHSSGESYDWRFFAIPYGKHELTRGDGGRKIIISDTPAKYSFDDCNADYVIGLPKGSQQFVDGGWTPREKAAYNY